MRDAHPVQGWASALAYPRSQKGTRLLASTLLWKEVLVPRWIPRLGAGGSTESQPASAATTPQKPAELQLPTSADPAKHTAELLRLACAWAEARYWLGISEVARGTDASEFEASATVARRQFFDYLESVSFA